MQQKAIDIYNPHQGIFLILALFHAQSRAFSFNATILQLRVTSERAIFAHTKLWADQD
jgi:hypothetical protein